jgi:asparaginyl-tRNA synthetase
MKNQLPSKSWMNLQEHYISAINDPWYNAVFEIQDVISFSTMTFFQERQIKAVHFPITTSSVSSPMGRGSDSKPVKIELFGVETYLADSMQFLLEYGCRFVKDGCYYIMPSFRGEQEDETHLSQFYHSEAEIIGSINDVIKLVEDYLRYLCLSILANCRSTLKSIAGDVSHIEKLAKMDTPLPQITFDEAIKLLDHDQQYIDIIEQGLKVLNRRGEQVLINHFGGFVWITEFDHDIVPFYQAFTDDERKSKSADLLFGLGELVGAGERHKTSDEVLRALKLHQVDRQPYEWYFRMKEEFPLQTSGFGLGTERFICWLLNHNDVRDCQIIPRFNGKLTLP